MESIISIENTEKVNKNNLSLPLMLNVIEKEYPSSSLLQKKVAIKETFGVVVKLVDIENYYNLFDEIEDFEKEKRKQIWGKLL